MKILLALLFHIHSLASASTLRRTSFTSAHESQQFLTRSPTSEPQGFDFSLQHLLPGLARFVKTLHVVHPNLELPESESPDDVIQTVLLIPRQTVAPPSQKVLHFRPVSVTVWCVMVLTIQCLVVFTALALSRNYDDILGEVRASLLTQTLTAASRCIAYPPMMCALFVACRMYVLATTGGLGEPPMWTKACMITASIGMTLQFLVVLILPMFTEHWSSAKDEFGIRFEDLAGERTDVHVLMESQLFTSEGDRATFQALQTLAVAFIYFGVAGVIVGILALPAGRNKVLHPDDGPRVSATFLCIAGLAMLYFTVFFLLWIGTLLGIEAYALRAAARQALFSVRKAPMVAVILLAAGIRDLNLNQLGAPPFFEQLAIVVAFGALALESVTALVIGANGDEQSGCPGVYLYKSHPSLHFTMHFFSVVVYCSLVPLVQGIYLDETTNGLSSKPVSSTTHAVLLIAALYFVISIVQCFVFMAYDLRSTGIGVSLELMLAANESVRICPLVAVLFIACRMRALQITKSMGAPPTWAQQAMFLSVFAIFLHVVSCLSLPVLSGKNAQIDADGMALWDTKPLIAAYLASVMKYVALFCLHGGVIMVCTAIFTMTPETAYAVDDGIMSRETLRYCLLILFAGTVFGLCVSFAKVLGIIFKLAVEGLDKTLLGLDINVRMAVFSIWHGRMNIVDVVVTNPDFPAEGGSETWLSPHLMKIKRVCIDIDTVKLINSGGKIFEFEEVVLQGINVNYEKPWKLRDNVHCVLEHVKSKLPQRTEPEPEAAPANVQVIFHKIKLEDITAEIFVSGPAGLGGQMNVEIAKKKPLEFPDFAKQVSDPNNQEQVRNEFIMFVVRTLMETVASNIGPGKAVKGAVKGCTEAAMDCMKSAQVCR